MKINKEVVKARFYEGKTQAEIAKELGCSPQGVWAALNSMGLTEKKMSMTPRQRLERRLKKDSKTGCWEFQGQRSIEGYGKIKVDNKNWRAHRLAYLLFVGEIPDGMIVCHRCDNPPCCNPDHLFLGTHLDNVADKVCKNRQAKGSDLPQKKYGIAHVEEVRRLKNLGLTHADIAIKMGISEGQVSYLSKGTTGRGTLIID
jgi:hypothetical protein